jgi:hypothetical protein
MRTQTTEVGSTPPEGTASKRFLNGGLVRFRNFVEPRSVSLGESEELTLETGR